MTTLWRQVLAALTDDTLDDDTRERIVARGAAQLAVRRAPEGEPPTADAVMDVAFHEFALLLTADQARTALREVRRG
ncbi:MULTISPECIES: hypothetical protein [Streptomyces]|uniref:hypothetical protein n=1 Tax=Streptomyces TaxID=1883 RepID=UPI00073DE08D|nr:hypothetical protein [Streptomyces sp. FBKL.4005]OYP10212.1 hypothetical protein CFC35_41170 [Streptomyces sp. FBKL.4005]CUW33402.1 hypothetical protein TUE45_pSRTUE45a_0034 [Streptomyces reticuli]